MNSKILALLLVAFAVISSAHAESYTFSDSSKINVPEYNRGNSWSRGGTKNDVVGSTINVSGTSGKISDLNVTITNLKSKAFVDMVFVLVGPNNKGVVLSSNAGGANEDRNGYIPRVNLTFDDQASNKLARSGSFEESQGQNKNLKTGSYQTAEYKIQSYYQNSGLFSVLDPVKAGFFGDPGMFTEGNKLAAFNDISANGAWELLAFDNYATDATSYKGWSMNFSTKSSSTGGSGAVPEPAEWALMALAAAGIVALKLHNKSSSIA